MIYDLTYCSVFRYIVIFSGIHGLNSWNFQQNFGIHFFIELKKFEYLITLGKCIAFNTDH